MPGESKGGEIPSGESGLEMPPLVVDYLGGQRTLTLATASPIGVPRATTLTFAGDGRTLYVWMRPDTTTAKHIEQNPRVAFTIDEYADDWRQTKGVQGTGEAQVLLNPDEIAHIVELFRAKYEDLKGGSTSNLSFFRITPTEFQFIDAASAAGGGDPQALGADYRRDLVYSVFSDLPEEELSVTRAQLQTVKVEPGTVLIRQGAPADKFFIIVEGEVEVTREDEGESRTVARLGDGQVFGEMAILRDIPRTATVRATVPTTLFAMDRDVFRGLVATSLGTTSNFDQIIQQRLEELTLAPPQ